MKEKTVTFLLLGALIAFGCSEESPSGRSLELLSNLQLEGGITDVWGYFDERTGKEYALVGSSMGVHIVDVSDARNPRLATTVNSVPGFDVKTWKHYMYSVTGGPNGQGGIVDLSDPEKPEDVGAFPSSHNIFISEDGFMYSACPGLRIFDLNRDPTEPELRWTDNTSSCHDAAVIGDRLYDFHGTQGTRIYRVIDPADPQFLGAVKHPSVFFHHSGWTSEDGNFLYICDEGSRHPAADISVWNIRDPADPKFVTDFKDSTAIVHNLYVVGDFAYVAYYTSGFRVFDVSDPNELTLVEEYDTSEDVGEFFGGAFGAFPFTRSGNIYVSDMREGLFVFAFNNRLAKSPSILAP